MLTYSSVYSLQASRKSRRRTPHVFSHVTLSDQVDHAVLALQDVAKAIRTIIQEIPACYEPLHPLNWVMYKLPYEDTILQALCESYFSSVMGCASMPGHVSDCSLRIQSPCPSTRRFRCN